MLKKILWLFGCSCLLSLNTELHAQTLLGNNQVEYNSKSPAVAEMQKVVDMQTNNFTGTASITIPLYNLKAGSISVPITLQYTGGGGIKADDRGDLITGVGWKLSAGGSVTRQVRGNKDEGYRLQSQGRIFPYEYPLTGTYEAWESERDSLARNLWFTYGGWENTLIGEGVRNLGRNFKYNNNKISNDGTPGSFPYGGMDKFNYGLLDTEPDLFYFDFGGYSGKFVFTGTNGNVIMLPHNQDLKIERTILEYRDSVDTEPVYGSPSGYPRYLHRIQQYIASFKITTPDNKEYYFGLNEEDRNETKVFNNEKHFYNGWSLSRIVDRNTGDSVEFTNTWLTTTTSFVANKQRFVKAKHVEDEECLNGGGTMATQFSDQDNKDTYVTAIKSSTEEVVFQLSPYTTISIKNRSSQKIIKEIQLQRVLLQSGKGTLFGVIDHDLLTNQFTNYKFEYYNPSGFTGYLAQDYWGYYNGAVNTDGLMLPYPGCSKAVNRSSAWPAMRQDALQSITYPTGGKVFFEYEPHTANTARNTANGISEGDAFVAAGTDFNLFQIIGGLRLKRIKNYDPVTMDTTYKVFNYNKFGTTVTSGHLYSPPALTADLSGLACALGDDPVRIISTHNMFVGSGSDPQVSYRNVTVQEEKNGITNGYTEYEYYDDTNTDSTFYANANSDSTNSSLIDSSNVYPSWQFKRLPENYLRGKEKEKRVYTRSGELLVKEKYTYKAKVFSDFIRGAMLNSVLASHVCETMSARSAAGRGMETMSEESGGDNDLYDDYGYVIPENIPDYPIFSGPPPRYPPDGSYHFLYTYTNYKMMVRLSKQIVENYSAVSGNSIDTIEYEYTNPLHVNATAVITRNSRQQLLKEKTFYTFDFNDVNAGDSTVYFMKRAFMNVPMAKFNYSNDTIVGGGFLTYKLKSRIDSAIIYPNKEFSLLNTNGLTNASLNITGSYPQSFAFPFEHFRMMTTYNYNGDNRVSHIFKSGNQKTVLLWDYKNRYAVAQVVGADSADIAYTSFETDSRGNWQMSSVVVDTTVALTGERSYNLSNGNITRSGLNSAKRYIVSYWSKGTAATISGTSAVAGELKNGWRYYEHLLPASATSVTISGTVKVDELRLYPQGTFMHTSTYDPLFGVSSSVTGDNKIAHYEYDGQGRLRFVRDGDKNIIKKADYSYAGTESNEPFWKLTTGIPRRRVCSIDTNYLSSVMELEVVDVNIQSLTYNTLNWIEFKADCDTCNIAPPAWQNTATAVRCVKNSSSVNTGDQEQEQKDMNPCSATYNQIRWVNIGTNLTACPLPPPPCSGPDKMMIGGVCVTGTKRIIAVSWDAGQGMFKCIYKYTFPPNCTSSPEYFEYAPVPCNLSPSCIMD